MKITKAIVVLSFGADTILLDTDYPCPFTKLGVPSQPNLTFEFKASYDTGVEYVRNQFGVEPEVISRR